MKKIFIIGLLILSLISFIFAQGNQNTALSNQGQNYAKGELTQSQIKNIIKDKNKLRINAQTGECPENCTCTGSVTKCQISGGREMTVTAGKSGNTIIQVKGMDVSTNVTLYKSEGKIYGQFKGNQTKEINITPDQVQERIREKLKLKNCTCENMTLNDGGIYQVQTQKRARLFYLFPVKEKVKAQISSETGEIIRIRNPWWGFLARDVVEEAEE